MKKIVIVILFLMIPMMVFAYPQGDVDGNNKVNSNDYIIVRKHILKQITLTGEVFTRADVAKDNKISSLDYIAIRKIILSNKANEDKTVPVETPIVTPIPTVAPTNKPTATPTIAPTIKPTPVSTPTPKPKATPTPVPNQLTAEEKICESVKTKSSIDYKPFLSLSKKNSSSDKYKDDYYAIKAAHDCANKYNKPVVVTKGTYHIYKKNNNIISVQTSTNFSGSTIYIHDEFDDMYKYMDDNIYRVELNNQGNNKCETKTIKGFSNDFASLAPKNTGNFYILINEQGGTKVLNRNKGNGKTEQETSKKDAYRVYNGKVQDPLFWDYKNSKISYTYCGIPSNQLVFENANFRTVVKADCKKCVDSGGSQFSKKRGIGVKRSNTKISNINHVLINTNDSIMRSINHKYSGFYGISQVADIVIENCTIFGLFSKTADEGPNSTYELTLGYTVNVLLNKVVMYDEEQLKDHNVWSAFNSNGCKNVTINNSKLNTISDHKNMYNLTVKNTVVGSRGVILMGTGDRNDNYAIFDNVTWKYRQSPSGLIRIRGDYGATWNGTITITNSTVKNNVTTYVKVIRMPDFEDNMKVKFNHPIYNPKKVTINGLKIDSSNVNKIYIFEQTKSEVKEYYLKHFQRTSNKNEEIKLSISNITGNGSNSVKNYPS